MKPRMHEITLKPTSWWWIRSHGQEAAPTGTEQLVDGSGPGSAGVPDEMELAATRYRYELPVDAEKPGSWASFRVPSTYLALEGGFSCRYMSWPSLNVGQELCALALSLALAGGSAGRQALGGSSAKALGGVPADGEVRLFMPTCDLACG
jgi:hypothetical protein